MTGPGAGSELRARLLPAEILPLFDDRFVRSCELVEEYVFRLALGIFRRLGLEASTVDAGTVVQIAARAGLRPELAEVPLGWILRLLAERGVVETLAVGGEGQRFILPAAVPVLDPEAIVEEQGRVDPRALPAFAIAALAAEEYPRFLRGEAGGEEVLFGPGRASLWEAYFAETNPLYAISNAVGAFAAERALPPAGGEILELGGGLGSGATSLIARLDAAGRLATIDRYRFTDVSIPFLRRGQKSLERLGRRVPLAFARLDMNRPFAEAGVPERGVSLVYGVNMLHVAHDLAFTLGEIRAALRSDGALTFCECVRPFPDRPVHVELVFNLLQAFRGPRLHPVWRPNGGFLTPEQWTAALTANGFTDVRVFPDIAAVREVFPSLVVGAITARPA